MDNAALKIGVLGVGRMGKNHMRILSLLRSVNIGYVYDKDPACLAAIADQYGVHTIDAVAEDFGNVDALFVLTPTSTHKDYLEKSLDKVPYIFVEKPLTGTVEETRQLVELLEHCPTKVQVGYIERFNPAVQVLKELTCDDRGIVNIDFTRTSKMSSHVTDVSVITDLMIHDIDLALYLNGPVESLVAHGFANNGLVEYASATLVHTSGSLSRLLASRITENKRRLIEVTCADKFVSCDLLRKEVFINTETVSKKTKTSYTVTSTEERVWVSPQEALLNEINSFILACKTNDFGIVPGAVDDLAAIEVADEIQKQIMRKQ
jgi:predicted dehydrogenase